MKYIKYGTEFLDQLKDSVHDLYDRNQELLSSNVKLREEKLRLNNIIDEAIEYIEQHNDYFLLKREVKKVLDILKGVNKE